MNSIKHLIYLGRDQDFLRCLKNFCQKNPEKNVLVKDDQYQTGRILELASEYCPCVIYIDFTDINDEETVVDEVVFLKRYKKYYSILLVSISGDSQEQKNHAHLYASGFQLGYIKGEEVDVLIADSLYIVTRENMLVPQYARAENIDQELKIGFCSTLTRISEEQFQVETDLDESLDHLSMNLPLFKGLAVSAFKIVSRQSVNWLYPMTESYVMQYPYIGPWDELSEETMQKETVETWLSLNRDSLSPKHHFIQIISKHHQLCADLYRISLKLPFFVELYQELDWSSLGESLRIKRPPLIFYDIDSAEVAKSVNSNENSNAGNNEEKKGVMAKSEQLVIDKLSQAIKKIEHYQPILIICNGPAGAGELASSDDHPNIIVITEELSPEIFEFFCSKYIEKKELPESDEGYFFLPSDPRRAIDVFHQVQVTTLSEHEITFISDIEFPMFCVLHLSLPVDCLVTIIPPYRNLKSSPLGKHYLGFIHGISEQNKGLLRAFVNKIIFRPLVNFTPQTVEAMLKRGETRKERSTPPAKSKEKVQSSEKKFFKPPAVQGKSKL